jgi:hypothetical protein
MVRRTWVAIINITDDIVDEWVLKAQQMASLNKPAERDYQSVEAVLYSKKPLVDEEYGFIYQKEDLITLRDGREMAVLDSFTERMLRAFHCSLLQVSANSTLTAIILKTN